MAGPGGKEVGRVSIRVVPNTEKFRPQLKRELKKLTKGLKVKIPVVLDGMGKAKAQLAELSRDRASSVKVGVDTKSVTKAINKAAEKAKPEIKKITLSRQARVEGADRIKAANVKVKPILDERRVKNLFKQEVKVKIKPTIENFANFDKLMDHKRKLELKVKPRIEAAELQKQLDEAKISYRVKIEKQDQLRKLFKDQKINVRINAPTRMPDILRPSMADKVADRITRIGNKLRSLGNPLSELRSHTKLILAAVLILAPVLVGLVATLLAGIPALISAFGAAGAAIALGMEGIQKAFSKLSPIIDEMKSKVSAVFERELAPMVTGLGKVLKGLTPQMETMAGSLVKMAEGFTNVITSASGMKMIDKIMENSSALMESLAPSLSLLTTGFLKLSELASGSFQHLTGTFTYFASEFNAFANRMATDGRLDKAFSGLRESLNGLTDLFFSLMNAGIETMGNLGPSIGRLLSGLGAIMEPLIPILGSVLQVIFDLAASLLEWLAPAFEALAPIIQQFADLFSSGIARVFDQLNNSGTIQKLADGLAQLFVTIEPLIPTIADLIAEFVNMMAENVDEYVTKMVDAFIQFTECMTDLVPIMIEAAPTMMEFVDQLMRLSTILTPEVLTLLTMLGEVILDIAMLALPLLIPLLKLTFLPLMLLVKAWGLLFKAISIAADWIGKIINFFKNWDQSVENSKNVLRNLATLVRTKFDEIKESIRTKLEEAKTWVQNKIDRIKEIFEGVNLFEIGRQIIQGLINGLENMRGALMRTATSLAKGIINAMPIPLEIKSPSRATMRMGRHVVDGLIVGMDQREDALLKKPKTMAERLRDSAEEAFKEVPKGIGQAWINSISSDLGFSSSGALGTLVGQLIDPQVRWEEEQNVYVVKDLDEAERASDKQKKKKSLRYTGPSMGR